MSGDQLDFLQGNRETLTGTLHDPGATTGDVLTVQADKSIAAAPGGGAGGVQVVTVPVSSAQILDLFNTPKTLVAGVAGQTIVPVAVSIAYLAGTTPYVDNGGNLQINPNNQQGFATAGFWDQAVNVNELWVPGYTLGTGGGTALASLYDGVDLELIQTAANPTLGDGTLLVTLAYFLAPVV